MYAYVYVRMHLNLYTCRYRSIDRYSVCIYIYIIYRIGQLYEMVVLRLVNIFIYIYLYVRMHLYL